MPDKVIHIVPDPYTEALYKKVQAASKKQRSLGFSIYLNGLAREAMIEFVKNHPELGVKA